MLAPLCVFTNSATIYRGTNTADSGGGVITTYSAVYSGVKCRVRDNAGNARVLTGRVSNAASYCVYFDGSVDVLTGDRIGVDGMTLDVLNVVNFDRQDVLLRADCEEVNE